MLKYGIIPLLLLTLVSCGAKKNMKHVSSVTDDNFTSGSVVHGHVHSGDLMFNDYYGCNSSGPIAVVNFDFDKSIITDRASEILKEAYTKCIHDYMSDNPNVKLLITGNTDVHGTVEYNIALGSRRAYAAKRSLFEISSHHLGDDKVANTDEAHKPDNAAMAVISAAVGSDSKIGGRVCVTSKGKEDLVCHDATPECDAKNRRVVIEFVNDSRCS